MPRYRAILTFPARDDQQAREFLTSEMLPTMPRDSSITIQNPNRRRDVVLGITLAGIVILWLLFLGLVAFPWIWRHL